MCQMARLVYLSCSGKRETHHHHFHQIGVKTSKLEDPLSQFNLKDIPVYSGLLRLDFPPDSRGCGNYDLHDKPQTGTATCEGGVPI